MKHFCEMDEKSKHIITEFTIASLLMIAFHTIIVYFNNILINYGCNALLSQIIGIILLLIVSFYIIPTIMYKRYLTYKKHNEMTAKLPEITYNTCGNIPSCVKFKNSVETSLHVVVFQNYANVYADNENDGSIIFSGNLNMCLREISDNWNNCKGYSMSIGLIPANSNGDDINTDKIDNYHNFKFELTDSDNQIFEKEKHPNN